MLRTQAHIQVQTTESKRERENINISGKWTPNRTVLMANNIYCVYGHYNNVQIASLMWIYLHRMNLSNPNVCLIWTFSKYIYLYIHLFQQIYTNTRTTITQNAWSNATHRIRIENINPQNANVNVCWMRAMSSWFGSAGRVIQKANRETVLTNAEKYSLKATNEIEGETNMKDLTVVNVWAG